MYKIIYLSDSTDCETCGPSWAEGYRIEEHGVTVVDKTPAAHCYSGLNFPHENALFDLAERLGIKLEIEHEDISITSYEEDWDD